MRSLGAEKLWKAMFGNGDTTKTALNARRTTRKCRVDNLYLKTRKRVIGGQNEREGNNGEEGRVLADCM